MNSILTKVFHKKVINNIGRKAILCRSVNVSSVMATARWRREKGLSVHRNAEGPLTDGPDYTFLDGRPTPLLHKQKLRMLKQREFAEKMVELIGEVDFALDRHNRIIKSKEEERQNILNNRLKAKGDKLKKK